MMVRKPVAAKKEETPLLPPYPISRISPRDGLAEGTAASGEMRLGASATGLDQEDRGFGGLPIASEGQKTSSGTRNGLPPALRVGKGGSIPPMLQAGSADVTPRSSWESERSISSAANAVPSYEVMDNVDGMHDVPGAPQLTNPYRRKQVGTGKAPERPSFGEESSADIWGDGKIKPLSSIGKQNYCERSHWLVCQSKILIVTQISPKLLLRSTNRSPLLHLHDIHLLSHGCDLTHHQ